MANYIINGDRLTNIGDTIRLCDAAASTTTYTVDKMPKAIATMNPLNLLYGGILSVINTGIFELSDILVKIDTLWLKGDVDDDQRTQLIDAAREKADPSASYAPLQEQVDKLAADLTALTTRVSALEGGETEPEDKYPPYLQPTGEHDAYRNGDKVTYNGTRYICIAPDGVACVWNPDTYPAYWQEVT